MHNPWKMSSVYIATQAQFPPLQWPKAGPWGFFSFNGELWPKNLKNLPMPKVGKKQASALEDESMRAVFFCRGYSIKKKRHLGDKRYTGHLECRKTAQRFKMGRSREEYHGICIVFRPAWCFLGSVVVCSVLRPTAQQETSCLKTRRRTGEMQLMSAI